MTSFPDENSSAVVRGSSNLMVIAANRFLSYVLFGTQSAIVSRSNFFEFVVMWIVHTILCVVGIIMRFFFVKC
jgi:hypothetical protein